MHVLLILSKIFKSENSDNIKKDISINLPPAKFRTRV